MTELPTKRTHPLPPLTLGREIGGTLYVVYGEYAQEASEDVTAKIKRLLLKEIQAEKPGNH